MAINYKTKSNSKKSSDKQSLGFQIIFFALNFLLVPFSAIATYTGYKGFLGTYLAIILAAVTGLLFFGLNFIIMDRRKKGEPHLKQTLGYLLPLLISFFGNFTYFYGNQMEGTLLNKDLTAYKTTFKKTYENAVSDLNNSTGISDLETNIKAELKLLKFQMETPPKGFGASARKNWGNIQKLFSNYNAKYNNSATTTMTKIYNKRLYMNFENATMVYFNSIKESKEKELNDKIKPLTELYNPVNKQADELLKSDNTEQLKTDGIDLIKKIKSVNDDIGTKAKGVIIDYTYKELPDYEAVNAKSVKSVLESAFIRVDNISATIFSLVISFVIDLATLAFVFLSLSYIGKSNKQTGPRQL